MCFSSIGNLFSSASSFLKPIGDIAAPLLAVGAAAGLGKQLFSPVKQGNSSLPALPSPDTATQASNQAQEKARLSAIAEAVRGGGNQQFLDPETGSKGVPLTRDLWGVGNPHRLF